MARGTMLSLLLVLTLAPVAAEEPAPALAVTEAGSHFFSGEQVVRTVQIAPGLLVAGGPARLTWRVSADGAVVLSGAAAVGAQGGAQAVLPMPRVQRATPVRLQLSLERGGAALGSGDYALQLYPSRPEAPGALKGKRIVLFDPTGRTAAALGYVGVEYDELAATWAAATGSADLFVVGDSVPADELVRFLVSVRERVAEGAVCLVLEQTYLDADAFPWLSLAPPSEGWDAWQSPAGTDVVRGELPEDALAGWRGQEGSVQRPFVTPARGNFSLLLDVGRGAQEAPATAVLEVPHGKGRYIFSQLLIARSFLTEPVARYALTNLLRYAASIQPRTPPVRAAVLADPQEERFANGFGPLGLDADVNPPALEGYGVAVICGSEDSERAFGRERAVRMQELRGLVAAGGKVVLLDLQPETADGFRGIWDGALELAPAGQGELSFAGLWDKPLVRGIRRAELEALCKGAEAPLITYRGRHDPAPVTAPGILAVAQGKGAIVFCQLPLPKDEDDAVALRTYSQLFTNLNLVLEHPNRRGVR